MTSKTLLDLSTEAMELDDLLASVEDADTPEVQALIAQMLDLKIEKEHKIDGYCALIREFELRSNARKEEATRLSSRAQTSQNVADHLKERLRQALEMMDIKKVETSRFTVTRAKNGGKQPMTLDETAVTDEYKETIVTVRANKDKIRTALDEGKTLDFAKLEARGEHLRIK